MAMENDTGHRDRLIREGLYEPMTPHDIAERNDLLRRIARGEKIPEPPIYVVYRADCPDNYIGGAWADCECQEAELIAERLRGYEAHTLCCRLNQKDTQLPPRPRPGLPPLPLYKIDTMKEWNEWESRHSQIQLEMGE